MKIISLIFQAAGYCASDVMLRKLKKHARFRSRGREAGEISVSRCENESGVLREMGRGTASALGRLSNMGEDRAVKIGDIRKVYNLSQFVRISRLSRKIRQN